jgi:hypothetical protein
MPYCVAYSCQMAEGHFGADGVKRLGAALQALRRGQADVVEVHGSATIQDEARSAAMDFITVFELDVVVSELPGGFQLELRERPERTIRLDL